MLRSISLNTAVKISTKPVDPSNFLWAIKSKLYNIRGDVKEILQRKLYNVRGNVAEILQIVLDEH